ncbi:MAG TPA: glutamate--cysteine ligase [Streptosporangiaceae bacterium]
MRAADHFPTFGVEEEFLVVDPVTRAVVPQAAAVLDRVRPELGERVSGELTKFQVETKSLPCHNSGELLAQLTVAREKLAAAAAAEGLRITATGTPVLGAFVPPPITEGIRQDRGNANFRGLHDEQAICALHVHVQMRDREQAVLVSNHLRQYLPTLIALTANSPYWAERDTGYASWRTMIWSRWPVAGPPPYFASAAQYDELIAILLASGALVDEGTIFWDIRPSARFPTLEVRVADMPVTAAESTMFAVLVRALAVSAATAVERGDAGPVIPAELLRLAYWRAARDGLDGCGNDVRTGRPVPAAELAGRLLTDARPVLAETGELDDVTAWLRGLTAEGTGAPRQRAAAARRGLLTDVVDHLVASSVPGIQEASTAG